MTKQEFDQVRRDFAVRLMAGLLACGNRLSAPFSDEARMSVERADALLVALGLTVDKAVRS